jgi:hypothetical protein
VGAVRTNGSDAVIIRDNLFAFENVERYGQQTMARHPRSGRRGIAQQATDQSGAIFSTTPFKALSDLRRALSHPRTPLSGNISPTPFLYGQHHSKLVTRNFRPKLCPRGHTQAGKSAMPFVIGRPRRAG